MKTMVQIVIVVGVVVLGGCGQEEAKQRSDHPSQSSSSTTPASPHLATPSSSPGHLSGATPPQRSSATGQTELMKKMGLQVEDGRIILDTEKSKNFFESLGRSIEKNIHQGVKKAEKHVPSGEEIGIKVEDKKVVIDLNKTRNFMKAWVETMEVLGRELNRSLSPVRP